MQGHKHKHINNQCVCWHLLINVHKLCVTPYELSDFSSNQKADYEDKSRAMILTEFVLRKKKKLYFCLHSHLSDLQNPQKLRWRPSTQVSLSLFQQTKPYFLIIQRTWFNDFCVLFVCGTCSDVAPASSPSAKEVASQPKSSALQGKWLQEPRSLLISLLTEGEAGIIQKKDKLNIHWIHFLNIK